MRILIRADSSSTIGTGHIMRDLVLAKQFPNDKIIFASQELEGNLNDQIPYQLEILKSNDFQELNKLIKKLKIDMIIIDHYGIDYNFEKQLKLQNKKLKIFVLDDTYKKHYCDILLNHNICANENKYKDLVPKNCELRCGSRYTLLRDEFYKEKEKQREKIYDVLIAMGGADTENLSAKLLNFLPNSFKIAIVTTTANKNLTKLKQNVKNKKNIFLHINSKQIAKLMNESKLIIVTPSVTVNEVYFMGLDFVAIKTAENQKEMYQYLKNNNFLILEKFDEEQFRSIVTRSLNENCNINI